MDCLIRRRRLPFFSGIPVTITGTGNVNKCYALSGGVKYYTNGDAFEAQTSIDFTVAGGGGSRYKGSVTINGGEVLSVTSESAQSYSWTIPNNVNSITIAMTYNQSRGNGTITVTTS